MEQITTEAEYQDALDELRVMSIQVASVITTKLCHVVAAMAFYDPKLECYIVTVTHSPLWKLGQRVSSD